MAVKPDVTPTLRRRTCERADGIGKRGWHTRAQAVRALRLVGTKEGRMDAYRCALCGLYHLGHHGVTP